MGMFLILIAFYLQSGAVTTEAVLLSAPSVLLVAAIVVANNIGDLEGDKKSGRKPWRFLPVVQMQLPYVCRFSSFTMVGLSHSSFLPFLLIIPKPMAALAGFRKNIHPLQVAPAMKDTASTNTFFGLLLAIGILIGHLF